MIAEMPLRTESVTVPLGAWGETIAAAVAPACTSSASVWERTHAVRELEQLFLPRFRAESARIAAGEARLGHRDRERLWAAGRLVAALHADLAEDARVPFRGAAFAASMAAFLRALDHWCAEVVECRRHPAGN